MKPIDSLVEEESACQACGADTTPHLFHSVGRDRLESSSRDLGLPRNDVVWARYGDRFHGFELAEQGSAAGGHQ
jgi:hypothetical protein